MWEPWGARRLIAGLLTGMLLCVFGRPGYASPEIPVMQENVPVNVEADDLDYNQNTNTVRATGNVVIEQGGRVLRADGIRYRQRANTVHATGNVSLSEPDGTVYYADEVELQDDMKRGVIRNFRARLKDDSRFMASEARRLSETVTELDDAAYTACDVCEDDPDRAPLWQIRADQVHIDDTAQKVTYDDVAFEVYGVPVAWSPYLSHPTPDADKKSGILVPKYKVDTELGAVLEVPVFANLAPNYDLTVTPILTSQEGTVLASEFRHLTEYGEYRISGSITNPEKRDALGNVTDGREVRGHIEAEGHFTLDEVWNVGFDAARTTDDTYLRRYDFSEEDTLRSRAYLEAVDDRTWANFEALTFQGLNVEDNPKETPLIVPLADIVHETKPGNWGERYFSETSAMVLTRSEGAKSRRLSQTAGVRLPYVTQTGHVFEVGAQVRGDIYSVDDVPVTRNGVPETAEGTTGRVVPVAWAKWRYPLANRVDDMLFLMEPVIEMVASSSGNNPDDIPNEDSQVLEFSDSNLFEINRFTGKDRVESGSRVNYGLRTAAIRDEHTVEAVVGQSARTDDEGVYPVGSGLDDTLSDVVGRVGYTYAEKVDVGWRFRLEKEEMTPLRSEVNSRINLHPVGLSLNYIAFESDPNISDRDEVFGAVALALTDNWTVSVNGRRDLSEGGGFVDGGAGLVFNNECLRVVTNVTREFTRDRDIEPSTSFMVQVFFRNLN